MFIFYLIFILSSFSQVSSVSCSLLLTCKVNCSNAFRINSLNNAQFPISLSHDTTSGSSSNFIQYSEATFACEPGDKIIFSIDGYEEDTQYKGGFIAYLRITGDNGSQTNFISESSISNNIFSCEPTCTLITETLQFKSGTWATGSYQISEYQGSLQANVKIEIPFEINIVNDGYVFQNIKKGQPEQNIYFSNYIKSVINMNDLTRLSAIITSIPNINQAKLYKGSNQNDLINVGTIIPLNQEISFVSVGDNYGLFELTYRAKVMNEEKIEDRSLKFNVCYQYCGSCGQYSSINQTSKKCTSCITGSSFIVEDEESDRCFSQDEIDVSFTNYYLDSTNQYKKCDISCKKCTDSSFNCTICNKFYYFVEGEPANTGDPNCLHINVINERGNYYLFGPPDGSTYNLCSNPCKSCRLNSDNCFSCKTTNNYFFSDEISTINQCKINSGITGNFYLVQDTYLTIDQTCGTISNNKSKKKCWTCAIIDGRQLYNYLNEDLCYLDEEIIYKYGINNYLDNSSPIKYKKCNQRCAICSGSDTNCLKCSDGYYFVEGFLGECKTKEEIGQLSSKYYLPKGSDTYYECIPNCVCDLKKDNCISCINNYNFKEDENKCLPTSDIVNGYYLNTNKVFKKCDTTCLTCDGEGPNKCLTCAEPYYFIQLEGGDRRCIKQIEKSENSEYDNFYLKIDNNPKEYKKCDISCSSCEDGIDGTQCIKCSSGYVFYEDGGKICKEKSTFFNDPLHYGYYFNENLEEFRKCHKSCKSCKDGEIYNDCYECNTDFVFIDDPSKGKCVLEILFQTKLKNYYDEMVDNHLLRDGTKTQVKVYKKCHENCDECNKMDENPLKCKICNNDKGFYKHTLEINNNLQEECFNNAIMQHKFFNGNGYLPSMSQCIMGTYESQVKNFCFECHNKYGFYPLEHAPETCQNIIPEDHYLTLDNIIKKCPYECASCSEGPTSISTNCDICKEEFPPSQTNPKNCIFQCEYYQYKFYDNKYCTGEKECPEFAGFLIKENSTCVQKCEKVSYYGVCLEQCPEKTISASNNICQDLANTCTLSRLEEIREHLVDLKKDITPVTKRVKKYRKYFDYTNSHIDIYNHYLNEYTMIVYQKNNCLKELLPDFISVDFPDCINYKQSEYIIVLFLIPRNNKYSQFYYILYKIDNLNNPIAANNFCQKVKIEVPHYQANFDIDKYQRLYKENIDLTNHLENFFHDMCFQNYEDGKDIVIKQRRKEYYQDPYKICIDNCNWNTPDYIYKRATCKCEFKDHLLDKINEEIFDYNQYYVMGDDFYNTDTNVFEHLKCFKYNFEDGNIFKNMGSYMIIIFFILEIISMIIYGVIGIDSIKMFIIDFIKRNPPKKEKEIKENEDGLNNENNSDNINNDNKDIKTIPTNKNDSLNLMLEKNNNDNIHQIRKSKRQILKNNSMILNKTIPKNKRKIKSSEREDLLIGRSNNFGNSLYNKKSIKIYQRSLRKEDLKINEEIDAKNIKRSNKNSNFVSSKRNVNNFINKENNANFEKHHHVFTDYELNSMELYDAEMKDKRSFCYFYTLQMKSKQEFYRTFCIQEPLYPFSIKVIIYIFNLSLNLVFNALLYTEDQIYEGIKSIGKDIGYIFLRSLYTFLIIKGIDYIINLVVKNSNYLRSLVYRRKKEKELRVDSYKSLKRVKANFCLLFIFVLLCDGLFWVYISSFCYCYNGEQIELFGAFLVTQFFIEIYCLLFALYLAGFRFIGLKYKAITSYKLSQTFLDT